MIELQHYLILAAALFCVGFFGAISRKNMIVILMSIEIMLNAINLSIVAFSRFVVPLEMVGHIFVIFIFTVAAVEVAVALAILLAMYSRRNTVESTDMDLMKW
tara:strand:+ start:916 stop:1224 length:309 start_codon:yes stop_codon:yes gene_type:complete